MSRAKGGHARAGALARWAKLPDAKRRHRAGWHVVDKDVPRPRDWRCPGATREECEATAALWRRHGRACEARGGEK
jgi:hypothetical protein